MQIREKIPGIDISAWLLLDCMVCFGNFLKASGCLCPGLLWFFNVYWIEIVLACTEPEDHTVQHWAGSHLFTLHLYVKGIHLNKISIGLPWMFILPKTTQMPCFSNVLFFFILYSFSFYWDHFLHYKTTRHYFIFIYSIQCFGLHLKNLSSLWLTYVWSTMLSWPFEIQEAEDKAK